MMILSAPDLIAIVGRPPRGIRRYDSMGLAKDSFSFWNQSKASAAWTRELPASDGSGCTGGDPNYGGSEGVRVDYSHRTH